jgi:hypothetical protein
MPRPTSARRTPASSRSRLLGRLGEARDETPAWSPTPNFVNDISNLEIKQQIAQDKATISMRPEGRDVRDRLCDRAARRRRRGRGHRSSGRASLHRSTGPSSTRATARSPPKVVDYDDPSSGVP